MDWIETARRLLRGAPEPKPEERIEALLPQFTPEGAWAARPREVGLEPVPAAERAAQVRRAIDALPELYRIALLLCDVEGLSKEEAAAALGVPIAALSLRLHRARQGLVTLVAQDFAPLPH